MELPKAYDHSQVEDKIYQTWLDSGYFNPDKLPNAESRKPFIISLPPPNVTGTLHMGHAFEDAIQDIMIRYQRMQGKRTLWLPGTDHAPIATESKVVKLLEKEEGKRKRDFSREEFVEKVKKFAQESHDTIVNQVKSMGASVDWSREAYTFDEPRNLSVRTAFKTMFDQGLIYRGFRVVNWDPKGQTVISDDEIVYQERPSKLYTFKYSRDFPIAISTTRPETKLGDTAVAVHPEDPRYQAYIGKEYDMEFCGTKIHIKVIADASVEKDFGTGALGVTPAHSTADFEMSQRHNLPMTQIIDEYGKMTVGMDGVNGKKTAEAREAVVTWLKNENLLTKEEDIIQNVSTAERTGAIIEPLPKLQWFINVNKEFALPYSELQGIKSGETVTLKKLMRHVVESGEIKITPERFEKIYYHWIDGLRDWCISRQLWFGHQIPVWYRPTPSSPNEGRTQERLGTEKEVYCDINPPEGDGWVQDSDTLDTWFSSGLWTFSTLGWPNNKIIDFDQKLVDLVKNKEKNKTYRLTDKKVFPGEVVQTHNSQTNELFGYLKIKSVTTKILGEIDWKSEGHEKYPDQETLINTFQEYYPDKKVSPESQVWIYEFEYQENPDLKLYHPTSLMMPGYEILFFWVARMILMSTCLLGQIPFKQVVLHGIVRDSKGRKFSKSLNNGVDPLEITTKYGTDALRMALVFGAGPGNDTIFDEQRVKGMKHFANKLWNISRYVLTNITISNSQFQISNLQPQTQADKEILAKLDATIKSVTKNLDSYNLHEAAQDIYQFTWREFADVYLEASKTQLADEKLKTNTQAILNHSIIQVLKLLHPFMPFITEHIWGLLQEQGLLDKNDLLIVSTWPK